MYGLGLGSGGEGTPVQLAGESECGLEVPLRIVVFSRPYHQTAKSAGVFHYTTPGSLVLSIVSRCSGSTFSPLSNEGFEANSKAGVLACIPFCGVIYFATPTLDL